MFHIGSLFLWLHLWWLRSQFWNVRSRIVDLDLVTLGQARDHSFHSFIHNITRSTKLLFLLNWLDNRAVEWEHEWRIHYRLRQEQLWRTCWHRGVLYEAVCIWGGMIILLLRATRAIWSVRLSSNQDHSFLQIEQPWCRLLHATIQSHLLLWLLLRRSPHLEYFTSLRRKVLHTALLCFLGCKVNVVEEQLLLGLFDGRDGFLHKIVLIDSDDIERWLLLWLTVDLYLLFSTSLNDYICRWLVLFMKNSCGLLHSVRFFRRS